MRAGVRRVASAATNGTVGGSAASPTADGGFLKQVVEGIRLGAQKAHDRFRKNDDEVKKEPSQTGITLPLPPDGKQLYEVRVYTGDVFNASTNANVFITLFGANDLCGGQVDLNEAADTNTQPHYRFQRGQKDVFRIACHPVGEIVKIRIGHDGTGLSPGWFLQKVEVVDLATNMQYSFACGRWFATNEDDTQLVRDLPVETKYTLIPADFTDEAAEILDIPAVTKGGVPVQVKDFAPKVFCNIRELYDIHTHDYVESWTLPDDKLVAKEGAGRSGSLFLRSNDNKFILKTIPHDEVMTFMEVLPNYYDYLVENRDTLIMKVVGVLRVRSSKRDMHVIIFTNVTYNPAYGTLAIYDLKGRVPKPGKALRNTDKIGTNYVFKDKDLDRKFIICDQDKSQFFTRLDKDINFFCTNNLMDYSLLVGVSSAPPPEDDVTYPPWVFVRSSEPNRKEVFHIGFIDCLTNYGLKKKMAHMFKTVMWNTDTLSTIDAVSYADRIKKYLFSIFDDDNGSISSGNSRTPVGRVPRTPSYIHMNVPPSDTLLTEKKVVLLEQKVGRMEERMKLLTDYVLKDMEAKMQKGEPIDASLLQALKFDVDTTWSIRSRATSINSSVARQSVENPLTPPSQ
eukprot:comp18922_c0_seq1/m.21111 comp18922_c0_seq1/g.21111  ORF comp18922_c0_seq1/g.21111 comp18922_c0_seq1/m.21111 type:complete len:624 (-) comp18922_c0_seq1:225-2096(-)